MTDTPSGFPKAATSSIDDAKRYLRMMQTVPDKLLGPLRWFSDPKKAEPLTELSQRVYPGIVRIDEKTYRAASVWHAAAWLLDQAFLIALGGTSDQASGLVAAYQPQYGTPIFRGQRDQNWTLKPTLFRSQSQPAHVLLSLELFIDAMLELMNYEENRMNTRFIHMAAAQHYGEKTESHEAMPTPLLDFTADPRIAIYFACRGADAARDGEVVVYGTPLNPLREYGRILLPPPWLRRLWAQRGLFLDCTILPEDFDLRNVCFRVLFPPDPEFAGFMFEQSDEALLPVDPWFDKAIAWAIESVKSLDATGMPESAGEWLRQECGDPPFRWYALMPGDMQEHLNQFVDMLEWMALKVGAGQMHYDLNTLDIMFKDNEQLFRSDRITWLYLKNVLSLEGPVQDRMLQALSALSQAVEEAFQH